MAWYCGGSNIASLTNYANNELYQELPRFEKYFTESDDKVLIDLRRGKGYTGEIEKLTRGTSDLAVTVTLKAPAASKMRLRVTGYYQRENLYTLSRSGLIVSYEDYSVKN